MKRHEYLAHDATGLAAAVRSGDTTPEELLDTATALADGIGAELNAIPIRFDQMARDRLASLPDGPLRGVPFLVKDLHLQLTGTRLTNGSRFYRDYMCDHDSELAARYLRAGLSIFGRSASPEHGITTSTESALWGRTRNPWQREHTAGGSSGGAAAAVAGGVVPAAHASDGGGSIRIPASCCGLFGLKPSRARVSSAPDKGHGWSGLSAQHAVTRSVRDSALLLDVAAGPVAGDPYLAPPQERPYVQEVGAPVGRLRVAWTTTAFNGAETHPECVRAVEQTVALCRELGHELAEARPDIDPARLSGSARVVVAGSLRAVLEERAAALGRALREDDVEPLTWRTATVEGRALWEYPRAVDQVHAIGRVVGRFFDDWDVLLSPTMAAPPLPLGRLALDREDGEGFLADLLPTIGYTQLMNVAGNPAMSVPLHWSPDGLPIGVQFAAAFGREDLLFRLAAQLEEARPWADRRPG